MATDHGSGLDTLDLIANQLDSTSADVPGGLDEIITLGRTLTKRATDVLAYPDKPVPATDDVLNQVMPTFKRTS